MFYDSHTFGRLNTVVLKIRPAVVDNVRVVAQCVADAVELVSEAVAAATSLSCVPHRKVHVGSLSKKN